MKKKIAAILPLYLAGMILLAFAVFPHHHHNQFICFNTAHCQETHDHSHSPYSDKSSCVDRLFQTDLTKNTTRLWVDNGEEGPVHHFTIAVCTLAEIIGILSFEAACGKFPVPRDEIFHQLILATHQGTRAPPCL